MAFDLDDQELESTRRMFQQRGEKMIIPKKEGKKVTLKDVSFGTNYDINKNLVKKYEKELTIEELSEKQKIINEYINSNIDMHYLMMLCHDKRDYTIFHIISSKENNLWGELLECLQNRGKIYGIDKTEDNQAFEIWLMIDDEAYCYYLFQYDNAIVEC